MSTINSSNMQVGQSVTTANNITLSTDSSGNLLFNKGAAGALTEISRISNTGSMDSAKVGFTPSGTGAVSSTVQAQLRLRPRPENYSTNAQYVAACQALATNQNFAQNGAKIERVPDRLLVGNAIDNDGAFPNVGQDWLTQWQIAAGLTGGSLSSATNGVLTTQSSSSNIAHIAGAQSKYAVGASQSTIGLFGFALNNHATLATGAWGAYIEAHKENAASAGCRGIEVDVRVVSGTAETAPFPNQQTTSSCLQLAAGAELSATGQQNVGACIQIRNNPKQFRKGIVFGSNSIEGTDGTSGLGVALAMSSYQSIDWYNNSNTLVARVTANTTTASGELRFTASGPLILGSNYLSVCRFIDVASAVNNIQIAAAATGSPPQIIAAGSDADIDLRLTTVGAGVLRFGAWTSNVDAAVNGYITIKDSVGNTRKLATIA